MHVANPLEYSFGTVNTDTAGRWLHLSQDEDKQVWMLNLMKYKEVADYGDESRPKISGREADDIYAPTEVLADLGATVPLFGDVAHQVSDDIAWERIGIVRYPSRRSFFEMQNRKDFQKQYVHKEAGMETTIIMGCTPLSTGVAPTSKRTPVVMRVRRFHEGEVAAAEPEGVSLVAHFSVDGVIVGDGRSWDDVRFDVVDEALLPSLASTEGVAEQIIVVVNPFIEDLIGSVTTAGNPN